MSSIKDFDVYEEVLAETVPENALKTTIPLFGFTVPKDLRLKVDLSYKVIRRLSLIRMALMLLLPPLWL